MSALVAGPCRDYLAIHIALTVARGRSTAKIAALADAIEAGAITTMCTSVGIGLTG